MMTAGGTVTNYFLFAFLIYISVNSLIAALMRFLIKSQDPYRFLFLSPQYESKKRISAEEAMKHSYFRQLGMRVHTLPESEHTHTPLIIKLLSVVQRLWFSILLSFLLLVGVTEPLPVFQVYRYSHWKKCSCRETQATGTPRIQSQVGGESKCLTDSAFLDHLMKKWNHGLNYIFKCFLINMMLIYLF